MCLAYPGKIIEIKGKHATVDFDGVRKEINISMIEAEKGDYAIVHAGFAVQKLTKEDAWEVLKIYESGRENLKNKKTG